MKLISYFYLLIATIIWSFATPLVKYALNDIDPVFFLFFRFGIVTLLCLPFLIKYFQKKKYTSYDWFNIILFSITGQVVLIIFFIGLDLTTATDSIIIGLLAPLVTIAAGHYFYRDRINLIKEIGIFLAFIGAILVIAEPLFSSTNGTAKNRFLGNLLISSNIIIGTFWVVYSKFLFGTNSIKLISFMKKVGIKLHKKKYDATEFNLLSFLVTFIFLIPFYLYNFQDYNQKILNISTSSLAVILYMAIFSSIVAYILYIKAQAKLEVSEVSILSYLAPLFSLPASFFILGEIPSFFAIIGLIVIFLGVIITKSADKIKLK
jgi:drug/metabolite transporter (DMT)-like permease